MDKYNECELIPNAHLLLSSLRSMGYTEETAISDIIDNSISANASNIEIFFQWENKRIIIMDNGDGMSQKTLLESMKIGSADPNIIRKENDLGRFGMGMKTAAFSLGKRLTVFTKENGICSNACWDLERIEKLNMWNVLIFNNNDEIISNCMDMLKDLDNGTVVIIDKLDKIIDKNNLKKSENKFFLTISKVKQHVGLVFHRFIEDYGLIIKINNNEVNAWDPFIRNNMATQELSQETYYDENISVTIEPFILPHKTKFDLEEDYKKAGGPKGWFQHQGFYIYRNKRLLIFGTWFNILKKELSYNLARIKIDMKSGCDFDWKIDIKKSKAVPPVYIEELLEKVAVICADKSSSVYNSRGTYSKRVNSNNSNLSYVWEQRKNSSGKYSFFLNKKHPILMELKNKLTDEEKNSLNAYLALVENYSPVMMSGITETMQSTTKKNKYELNEREKDILHIKKLIQVFRKNGFENEEIFETINNMSSYRYMEEGIRDLIEEEI